MSQRTRLDESYHVCRQAVLRARSNLGRAFWLLAEPQRRGMDALYAFARQADDLVDNATDADSGRAELQLFRTRFLHAIAGEDSSGILPAVVDTIRRFEIPPVHFENLLRGVEMDLNQTRYANWGELHEYCYRVASTVGLACICIWGCRDERAQQPAIDCGLALQLTNILRDVREDTQRGRIYLPLDELSRFHVTEQQVLVGDPGIGGEKLMQFQIERAKSLYASAGQATEFIPPPARRLYWLMQETYFRLLRKIERQPEVVFRRRVQLSWQTKLWLAARATLRL